MISKTQVLEDCEDEKRVAGERVVGRYHGELEWCCPRVLDLDGRVSERVKERPGATFRNKTSVLLC